MATQTNKRIINLSSDNVTGISSEIIAAIVAANQGSVPSYGGDELTRRVKAKIARVFETEVEVFLVNSGTAANALALSAMTPRVGAIYCHQLAHIETSENGAPAFFAGGAKLVLLPGDDGRIAAASLRSALAQPRDPARANPPAAVSVTQATEAGTVYPLETIRAIAETAHGHGLKFHMDGARLANALARLGCSPAELTWRAGVDALSLGATKNGALNGEAVVLFDRTLAQSLAFRHKQAGQQVSKMRFAAAQFDAYLTDDLWLKNARHANAMGERLAKGLKEVPGVGLRHPVEINEIFVTLPKPMYESLVADGFVFQRRGGEQTVFARMVTAFNTSAADVDAFIAAFHRHAKAAAAE